MDTETGERATETEVSTETKTKPICQSNRHSVTSGRRQGRARKRGGNSGTEFTQCGLLLDEFTHCGLLLDAFAHTEHVQA